MRSRHYKPTGYKGAAAACLDNLDLRLVNGDTCEDVPISPFSNGAIGPYSSTNSCRYAVWYGAGLAAARSWVRIPPVAAVYQRQLSAPSLRPTGSVNEYQLRKLGSKRAYHVIHYPRIRGLALAASAGVHEARERTLPTY